MLFRSKYYGEKWYNKFFNFYHLNNSILQITESSVLKNELIQKYSQKWYDEHIISHKLMEKKIIYSYESIIKYENEKKNKKEKKSEFSKELEDFNDYTSGLVQSPYFTMAIDTEKQEARPAFAATAHKLFFNGDPDVSYYDDLITLNYTEESIIKQYDVTATMLANPAGASTGLGMPTFNPPSFPWAGRFLLE